MALFFNQPARGILFAAALSLAVSCGGGKAQGPPLVQSGGTATGPAWSDEFNGPGIDTSKWAFDMGNGPTNPGPLYG